MRITLGFMLLVSVASCDGGSKPTAATEKQSDAQTSPPSSTAIAARRCPALAYVHAAPAFCVPVPAGFTQRTDLANGSSVSFHGPDGQHFSVSWAPIAERIELEARDRMDRTSSERHRGGAKRGVVVDRGLRWQQTTEDSAVDVFVARVVTSTHVVSCVTSFPISEAPEAVLDTCKQLQVDSALPLAKSVLDDVPGLVFETANATQRRTASDLNRAGLQHHRAGDYTAAREKLVAALVADPGNVLARYNLACTLNRSGERTAALTLLAELAADEYCEACRRQLDHARTDPDFADASADPLFRAITKGTAKTDPTYPPLAAELARAIQTRSAAALSPLVDASISVKVRRTCGSCDAPEQPTALQGKDAVLAGLAVHEQITTVTKATCDAVGCCTYDFSALPGPADEHFGDASPPRLGRACFGRGSAGAYVVTDLWLELP